jgi:hypothetical protein
MATKTDLVGNCPRHGEFFMDTPNSPCPSCEDATIQAICPACKAVNHLTEEDAEDDVTCLKCGDSFGICRTCRSGYNTCGDGYDGECPDCADRTEKVRLSREAEEELFETSPPPGSPYWTIGNTSDEDEVGIRVEDEKDKSYLAAFFPFHRDGASFLWMKVVSYLEDGKTQVSYEVNPLRDLWYGEGGPDVAKGKQVREVSQELAETLGLCDTNGVVLGTTLGEDGKSVLPMEKDAPGPED